jgi:hypothetical protein
MARGSQRHRDQNAGAAKEDHCDKGSSGMNSVRAMLDDTDLVIDTLHPSVGKQGI